VKEFTEQQRNGILVLCYAASRLAPKFGTAETVAVPADSRAREWAFVQTKRREQDETTRAERRLANRRRLTRALRFVAIFFLVFLIANIILLTTVEAYREAVIRVITHSGPRSIDVHFENQSDTEPIDASELVYEPTYLPKGYKFDRMESWFFGTTVYYTKGKKEIRFDQESTGVGFSIDNEHGDTGRIKIQGNEGIYVELIDGILLVWSNGEATFQMKGDLSMKELQKIAESVVKK